MIQVSAIPAVPSGSFSSRDSSSSCAASIMTDCATAWNDKFYACTESIGGGIIPTEPTANNTAERLQICASDACQQFITVFKALISTQCDVILKEVAKFPNGLWTSGYCPQTQPPKITTPAPTTKRPVTLPPAISSPPVITPAPTTTPVVAASSSSSNKPALIGGIVGGVAAVLVVCVVFFLVRRRRRQRNIDVQKRNDHEAFAYTQATTTGTNGSLSKATGLLDDQALAAVRIPLEKIHIGEVISQGGYGEVARGDYNGLTVAIKRLPAGRRKDPAYIRGFFEEIQLTATLEHDCIVHFVGVAWNTPADLCMVSEYMPGGDLRALLAGYAMNGHVNGHDDDKLRMAVQVAHALTYLHTLQTPVVHRDLKSRNVLLSTEGHAKLIDFGVSTERQDVTMTAGVGTSLWMAPEVMLGLRYDEKADIFSFGVILSELDTHELPYDHVRDPESNRKMADMLLMQLVTQGQLKPRFTPAADPDIVALALRCLDIDPLQRPRASEVLYCIHQCRKSEVFV